MVIFRECFMGWYGIYSTNAICWDFQTGIYPVDGDLVGFSMGFTQRKLWFRVGLSSHFCAKKWWWFDGDCCGWNAKSCTTFKGLHLKPRAPNLILYAIPGYCLKILEDTWKMVIPLIWYCLKTQWSKWVCASDGNPAPPMTNGPCRIRFLQKSPVVFFWKFCCIPTSDWQ